MTTSENRPSKLTKNEFLLKKPWEYKLKISPSFRKWRIIFKYSDFSISLISLPLSVHNLKIYKKKSWLQRPVYINGVTSSGHHDFAPGLWQCVWQVNPATGILFDFSFSFSITFFFQFFHQRKLGKTIPASLIGMAHRRAIGRDWFFPLLWS